MPVNEGREGTSRLDKLLRLVEGNGSFALHVTVYILKYKSLTDFE